MRDNEIGDRGCCMIADAIWRNGHVREVDLSGNSIGLRGNQMILAAIRFTPELENVGLDGLLFLDMLDENRPDLKCPNGVVGRR